MLNKKEFIARIAEVNTLKKVEAERALDAVLAGFQSAVATGDGVQLLGYFTVNIKDVAEVTRPNPQNRAIMITTPAHQAVKVKAGSTLQDALAK